jgi:glycosyltransferase involved in cell wall biosynthesis
MACGAAAVASRVGGLPEVIVDGVSGILEPAGSVEAMARRAVEVLQDPVRLRAMKDAAIAQAATFSAERIVPMYEEVYARALA